MKKSQSRWFENLPGRKRRSAPAVLLSLCRRKRAGIPGLATALCATSSALLGRLPGRAARIGEAAVQAI